MRRHHRMRARWDRRPGAAGGKIAGCAETGDDDSCIDGGRAGLHPRCAGRKLKPARALLVYLFPLVFLWPFVSADAGDEAQEEPVFERHTIIRPKVEIRGIFGSTKRRVGNYASIRRKIGATLGFDTRFSLDIATFEGHKLRVEGTLHHEDGDAPEPGFGDYLEETLIGTSDIGPPLPYWEQLTASIVEVNPPREQWTFSVRRDYVPGQLLRPRGSMANGTRSIDIESTSAPDAGESFLEVREHGVLLGRWASTRQNDYSLRADLSPRLKILALAAMEIFAVNHIPGPYRFPLWGPW